jgi:perosamine synthetase
MLELARFTYHQARNLGRFVSGRRLTYSSLVSTTLDADDVEVARRWLEDPRRWTDESVVGGYEDAFSRWNGSAHAFAFMGGRVALSAAIHALGLRPGDEVIVPAYTCVVVDNAFRFAGVTPVYADIELETYGLDAEDAAARITGNTKAILLQHLYGLVCRDYEAILDLAARKGLKVIEDCAHAAGAAYRGVKVGNRGDVAVYSSERSKPFNTILGGVAATRDAAIAAGLREFRDAAPWPDKALVHSLLANVMLDHFECKHPYRWALGEWQYMRLGAPRLISTSAEEERGVRPQGYGARMAPPVAALGLNQLRKIDRYNAMRRAQAQVWSTWCKSRGYAAPRVLEGSTPVFLRYPVMVEPWLKDDPRSLREELGVDIGGWFVSHLHPAKDQLSGFVCADKAVAGCINLPTILC